MAHQLRDPTHEELFVGPSRALPADIQELPAEETACTFCGVSYFVFAEVQALQRLVKSHKTAFRVRKLVCGRLLARGSCSPA